jgi:DNA-nicking Smr family endonuclease
MKRAKDAPPLARARRRKGEISPEDRALWAHVARSAKPLPGRVLPELPPEPAPAIPVKPTALAMPPAAPKARVLPPLSGIEKRMTKQVSRGQVSLDARIDLHGMRQAEAHSALIGFIHRAHRNGAKLVLVITGKGGEDEGFGIGRGVLRRLVPHWLADPSLRREVIGFETASRGHGGEGALYVRIRRRREIE